MRADRSSIRRATGRVARRSRGAVRASLVVACLLAPACSRQDGNAAPVRELERLPIDSLVKYVAPEVVARTGLGTGYSGGCDVVDLGRLCHELYTAGFAFDSLPVDPRAYLARFDTALVRELRRRGTRLQGRGSSGQDHRHYRVITHHGFGTIDLLAIPAQGPWRKGAAERNLGPRYLLVVTELVRVPD